MVCFLYLPDSGNMAKFQKITCRHPDPTTYQTYPFTSRSDLKKDRKNKKKKGQSRSADVVLDLGAEVANEA